MGNIGPIRRRFEVLPDDLDAKYARARVEVERAERADVDNATDDRERRRSRG